MSSVLVQNFYRLRAYFCHQIQDGAFRLNLQT